MWNTSTTNIFIITKICVLSIGLSVFPVNAHTTYANLKPILSSESLLKEKLYHHQEKIYENIVLLRNNYITVYRKIVNCSTDYLGLFGLFIDIKGTVSKSFVSTLKFLENINRMSISKKHIILSTSMYPSLSDFRESSRVLAFLQKFYMLNVTKLRDGEIQVQNDKANTYLSHSTLNSFDMCYIGIIALKKNWNNSGMVWIRLADRVPYFLKKMSRNILWHKQEIPLNRNSSNEKLTPARDEFHVKTMEQWINHLLNLFGKEHALETMNNGFVETPPVDCKWYYNVNKLRMLTKVKLIVI